MGERRRCSRVNPPGELVGLVKASIPAVVVDLSVEGVQVELDSPLRPAAECDLALPLAEGNLKLRARVCRCRAMTMVPDGGGEARMVYRAGLAFFALEETDRQRLEDAIIDMTLSETGAVAVSGGPGPKPVKIQIDPRFVGDHFDD